MDSQYLLPLQWIDEQFEEMCSLLEKWVNLNSYSNNPEGLKEMKNLLEEAFSSLGGTLTRDAFSLLIKKNHGSSVNVLLGGHMDTVYPQNFPLQKNNEIWIGPGVADMKGGLIVLLYALKALENSPFKVNWSVIINHDEEIGSSASSHHWLRAAKENDFALLFEPTLEDGSLVIERKGSANYTLEITGKKAHVGRNFEEGLSAIHALASFIEEARMQQKEYPHLILNFGKIFGGESRNVVADKATAHFNIRSKSIEEILFFEHLLEELANKYGGHLQRDTLRHPKSACDKTKQLFSHIQECGKDLGMTITGKATGGVCDGNTLAEGGLPCIDTMGVNGGALHSENEFLLINSLKEKAKLTALILMRSSHYDFC